MNGDERSALRASVEGRAASPHHRRATMAVVGCILAAAGAIGLDRAVIVRPGAAEMIVVSRFGEVTDILGPGQVGYSNPLTQTRTVYDTALLAADRLAGNRGMAAISAEGHPVTVFGTAFWREGSEADIRWRFANIRNQGETMQALMAASVQAVIGRHSMDEVIRRSADIQTALTDELKARVRALLRVDVVSFTLTGINPGESFRQATAEREMDKARAASVAASPALTSRNSNALELERIRRWDGRGIIPDMAGRGEQGEVRTLGLR